MNLDRVDCNGDQMPVTEPRLSGFSGSGSEYGASNFHSRCDWCDEVDRQHGGPRSWEETMNCLWFAASFRRSGFWRANIESAVGCRTLLARQTQSTNGV